jgi:hypothetical protein
VWMVVQSEWCVEKGIESECASEREEEEMDK